MDGPIMSTAGHFSLAAPLSPQPLPRVHPLPGSVPTLMDGILRWHPVGAGTTVEAAAGEEEGEGERMGHFLPLTTRCIPGTGGAPCDHSPCWEAPRSCRSPRLPYETPLLLLVPSSPGDGSRFLQSQLLGSPSPAHASVLSPFPMSLSGTTWMTLMVVDACCYTFVRTHRMHSKRDPNVSSGLRVLCQRRLTRCNGCPTLVGDAGDAGDCAR